MKITKKDHDEHGYTEGCPGYDNHRFGKYAREHTEECRKRISEAQGSSGKGDEKRKTAEDRMRRQQERSEDKEKPKEASRLEKD